MDSHSDAGSDPFDDGSSSEASFNDAEDRPINFPGPDQTKVTIGRDEWLRSLNDEEWEELGRNIANHTRLDLLSFYCRALNDHKMCLFFRGLTNSSSLREMHLYDNRLSITSVQSMVPFLESAHNLKELYLNNNNIQSEGFSLMFRALRDSPIETLLCNDCGVESIEIENDYFPKHLITLRLSGNNIETDGCRGLANLLQGGDSTLEVLDLSYNFIDNEGVEILVDALQSNTSLKTFDLGGNDGISNQGRIMLLKLVNDISSITATLHSNHTLTSLDVEDLSPSDVEDMDQSGSLDAYDEILLHINEATSTSRNNGNPEASGRAKVIQTQLHSEIRAELCRLQGVDHSVYSDIDPLHLPEVLSLIGRHHGQGQLYLALKSSIMTLFSTVNVRKCIQQQRAYHAAIVAEHAAIVAEHRNKMEELDGKLTSMDEAVDVNEGSNKLEHRSNKRRRKWWWGLWGGA
eukprot:scaffold10614_cov82-Skeletonema_dohrnii-CCMP3373.AAC.2